MYRVILSRSSLPCWIKKLAADSIQEKWEAGERKKRTREEEEREGKDPRKVCELF